MRDHRGRRLPPRRRRSPLKARRRRGLAGTPSVDTSSSSSRGETPVGMVEGRDVWWHESGPRRECAPDRWTARTRCSCSTPPARRASRRASSTRPAGTSLRRLTRSTSSTCTETDVYWCTADVGWVTGHSYIVYGPLANGATVVMYEGARTTRRRPLVGDRREARRDDLLHRADGDSHVHAVGRRVAGEVRPVEPARPRHGRRADQPGGLDVVPRAHRRRSLPDRRHVVADRDRGDHDHAAARRDADQARLGDAAAAGRRRRGRGRQTGSGRPTGADT